MGNSCCWTFNIGWSSILLHLLESLLIVYIFIFIIFKFISVYTHALTAGILFALLVIFITIIGRLNGSIGLNC